MSERANIIKAEHPTLSMLYAAYDQNARYVTAKVQDLRFTALLTPYRDRAEAEAALIEAGAIVPEGGAK